jgi:hypothetical protein
MVKAKAYMLFQPLVGSNVGNGKTEKVELSELSLK